MVNAYLCVGLLLAGFCGEATFQDDGGLVAYAKSVDVAILDARLQRGNLEEWLDDVVQNRGSVQWRTSSCSDTDRPDPGLCVRCDIDDSGATAAAVIQLGTRREGITGTPRLRWLEVPPYTTGAARLSELPQLMARGRAAIGAAKLLDARTLDPTLPALPLDEWLRRGPAKLENVKWQVSDCDFKPKDDEHPEQKPVCVNFIFEQGSVLGRGIIVVGTLGEAEGEPARLVHMTVGRGTGAKAQSEATGKLSRLPELVAKYRSIPD